ncbi:MAG: low molecular weight protein-tyrosine-phosphatase [Chitinophagales bacterium]|nr:low molecular weight phosphotyrosine protein phosphatase [Chitinophagales bacterium]MDW8394162.1 low molecular weight protein-tyrosine-phosphatase [Chitinophagales bacterium]
MKLLFVCLGNICRSPMAEGIMNERIKKHGLLWTVDSAGTERYHVGERPDPRAIAQCRLHGIDIASKRARQISRQDFNRFDLLFALATDVQQELVELAPHAASKIHLLLDVLYPGENRSVPDPWYGNEADFAHAYDLIDRACDALVQVYAPR